MSNYRRYYAPGVSCFFTVVTERRAKTLGNDLTRDLSRAAFRDCFERRPPFRVDAIVMLRDHLHAIWTLPPDNGDFSKRWGAKTLKMERLLGHVFSFHEAVLSPP